MAGEAAPAAPPDPGDGDAQEEKACRYCFEGEESGTLISPCRCAGGQKWVHLSCLRRWQRGVLVSQPTHPDMYDDDIRHKVCNVCKAVYSCKPPTRLELMQSFTGEELAALVEVGCIIGTSRGFSQELQRQVGALPEPLRESIVETNWIDGAFLIVQVVEDKDTVVHLRIHSNDDLQEFVSQLTEDWCWQMRGRSMRLLFVDGLEGANDAGRSREQTLAAIRALADHGLPLTLKLEAVEGADCGEDGIVAVNLTQPVDISAGMGHVRRRHRLQAAIAKVVADGETLEASVRHFRGGPCQKDSVTAALVISGSGVYETHFALTAALRRAHELSRDKPRARGDGDPPEAKRPRTDAEGATQSSSSTAPGPVRVEVFWGTAGWSRCQLMGEIASGSWGLCKAAPQDVTDLRPEGVYEAVYPRLVFAPKTEMSESYAQEGAAGQEERQAATRARLQVLRRRLRRREEEARRLQARLEEVQRQVDQHEVQEEVVSRAREVVMQWLDEEETNSEAGDLGAIASRLAESEGDSDEDCMEDIDAEEGEEEEALQEDMEEEPREDSGGDG